jgi:hypothetical protein
MRIGLILFALNSDRALNAIVVPAVAETLMKCRRVVFIPRAFLSSRPKSRNLCALAGMEREMSGNVTLCSIKAFAGMRREISTLVEVKYDKT